jgi:Protein of unknown function (DUF3592)
MVLFIVCYIPVALIFLGMGLFQLRKARREFRLASDLAQTGRVVQGEILEHAMRAQGRRSFWSVSYKYSENDKIYEGEQEVSRDHYELLTDAEQVDIRYLTSDPSVSALADEDRDDARMKRYRNAAFIQFGIALACVLLLLVSLTFAR